MAFRFEHPETTAPGTWRSPSMSPRIVSQRGACRAHWHSPDTASLPRGKSGPLFKTRCRGDGDHRRLLGHPQAEMRQGPCPPNSGCCSQG